MATGEERRKLKHLYTRRGRLRIRLRHESEPTERRRITGLLQAVEDAIAGVTL